MTIQFLRYIVLVAEIGSITKAARQLHISQPSLSAALKEAEKEVGFAIFTRSRNGIALTKEGVEFLGYARQVIQEMNLLEDRFILNKPKNSVFVFQRNIILLRPMPLWKWFKNLVKNDLSLS